MCRILIFSVCHADVFRSPAHIPGPQSLEAGSACKYRTQSAGLSDERNYLFLEIRRLWQAFAADRQALF